MTVEVPDAGCHFINEVMIVGYQQHRALISLQSNVECVDGFEVQVVRGFVQHQNVWLLQHELAEQNARRLAAGEHVSLFVGFIAGKEHLAEEAANFFVRHGRIPLEKPVKNRPARLNHAAMVLGKESYCRFMSPVDFASAEKWP